MGHQIEEFTLRGQVRGTWWERRRRRKRHHIYMRRWFGPRMGYSGFYSEHFEPYTHHIGWRAGR